MKPSKDINQLLSIMKALRTPVTGCPWDLEQDFQSIKPYTIEEAYEVADAIERGDMDDLREELGDLLLQVVFHAQMAEEANEFSFGDVVEAITRKMIRRHPHVFAVSDADDPAKVKKQWDEIKAEEKREKAERRTKRDIGEDFKAGLLDEVDRAQPALSEALKLQKQAAKIGFDWSDAAPILDKIEEEIAEFRDALASGDKAKIKDELGDLTFALVNLGRHVDAEPEMALRGTNTKFRKRFRFIEQHAEQEEKTLNEMTLDEMENLWQQAKQQERGN